MNTKSKFREYLQRPACGLSLAALLCLAARPAAAQTWDATADFSVSANPNGAWSYGYAAYDGSAYALMTLAEVNFGGQPGLDAWDLGAGSVPCVVKNTSANTYFGWGPGVLGIHPGVFGSATEHAVVTWTAPANGYYQFTSSFTYVGGGGGAGPSVTKNIRLGPGVYVGIKSGVVDTSAPVMTWNETLQLVAGDTISWAVNSAGNHGGDSTVLSAEVTVVPMGCWDANVDFSTTSATNVNGAWSYEWVNSSTSTGGLMTFAEANFGSQPGLNAWDLGAGSVPCVVKNTSLVNTYYGWAPGKLGMHPNTSSADKAAIRWTAPSNGVYQVSASATHVGAPGGDGVDVAIYRNLAGSLAGSLWAANLATGAAAYYDGVYSLTQGESLALVLGNGGAGNNGSDSTTVDFVVTPLPLAAPVLWDARADFSATANANVNDVWSYEWANTSSSTAGLIANMDLDGFSNPGLNTWYVPGSPAGLPSVMKNNGGFTYYGLTPGKLGVNPYVASQPWNEAVIRWTAPYDGTFQFAAAWKRVGSWGISIEDGVNVSVHTNFTGSLSGSLWTGNSFHGVPAQWSGTYTLTKGESLAFVTGNGGVDNFGSDTTAVDIFVASAAPTPLPVLSCTPSGNNLTLSWPVDVTGWTLESSTDLGITDAWDPVPGVVNNSITVPMTEARQFFRLKQ